MRKSMGFLLATALSAAAACAEKADVGEEADEAMKQPGAVAAAPAASVELKVDGNGLLERARVTDETARAMVLATARGGSIVAAELEEEDGAFIYSYDVRVLGRTGIDEVHVDAVTGLIVSTLHEDPSVETDEANAENGPTK